METTQCALLNQISEYQFVCVELNLYLDITGRLPSGRHSLNIATQSVDIYDDITVSGMSTDSYDCRITCNNHDIT